MIVKASGSFHRITEARVMRLSTLFLWVMALFITPFLAWSGPLDRAGADAKCGSCRRYAECHALITFSTRPSKSADFPCPPFGPPILS